jgi:hypothetical protein
MQAAILMLKKKLKSLSQILVRGDIMAAPNRFDTMDRYYKHAGKSNMAGTFFLWCSIVSSFVVFFMNGYDQIKNFVNVFFIVVTFLFFIFSNLTSLYFLRKAENKRVTHLLSNSLGVPLDDEETNLYYNNRQVHSIVRLGLNIFENSLHSTRTSSIMIKRDFTIVVMYVVFWLIFMLNRNSSLDLLSIISQTLLTTTLLTNFLKLVVIKFGCERTFNDCRNLFLHGIQENQKFNAQIIELFVRYESLKASMGISLSSKIFFKYVNPATTVEWERIKSNLGIE